MHLVSSSVNLKSNTYRLFKIIPDMLLLATKFTSIMFNVCNLKISVKFNIPTYSYFFSTVMDYAAVYGLVFGAKYF